MLLETLHRNPKNSNNLVVKIVQHQFKWLHLENHKKLILLKTAENYIFFGINHFVCVCVCTFSFFHVKSLKSLICSGLLMTRRWFKQQYFGQEGKSVEQINLKLLWLNWEALEVHSSNMDFKEMGFLVMWKRSRQIVGKRWAITIAMLESTKK